jgi:hypothetical protein
MLARLDEGHPASDGVVRVANILEWGPEFEALATHPRLLAIAHALLGDDACLGAFSGRVLMPGCDFGTLHVDYPYWVIDTGPDHPISNGSRNTHCKRPVRRGTSSSAMDFCSTARPAITPRIRAWPY